PQILGCSNSLPSRLCSGPTAPVWDYVTRHVRSHRNVKKIRGNLRWYPKFWGVPKNLEEFPKTWGILESKIGGGASKNWGRTPKFGGFPKVL
ncbi:HAUS5 protein, partial [Urocynchramus pylzowi]|nr:HAUS5 protein [Urocynchramus pylzowi]